MARYTFSCGYCKKYFYKENYYFEKSNYSNRFYQVRKIGFVERYPKYANRYFCDLKCKNNFLLATNSKRKLQYQNKGVNYEIKKEK